MEAKRSPMMMEYERPAHTLRDWDQERAGRIDVRKDRKKDQAQPPSDSAVERVSIAQ